MLSREECVARCLVIGGNGFMGSYVVDELVAAGHDVSVFDRFSTDAPSYDADGVRKFAGDFLNHADVREAVAKQDYVFHFLSTTTPASADNEPTLDLRTNVAASVDLFELAVAAGVRKVYFASTGGAIYGDQNLSLISEGTLPEPVSPYAIGKQAIEGYLRYFAVRWGLDSTSFRISNPYGDRARVTRRQGVIPIFLHRIAAGQPIDVYGDGSAVRDYVYVRDVARMIVATVDRPTQFPVYNIGSGTATSLSELIGLAREVTGRSVEVRPTVAPKTYVDRAVLDISRYVAEFGAPELTPLRDGLELTWRHVLEQRA
jgi:UDP-glucose 4-epimerase